MGLLYHGNALVCSLLHFILKFSWWVSVRSEPATLVYCRQGYERFGIAATVGFDLLRVDAGRFGARAVFLARHACAKELLCEPFRRRIAKFPKLAAKLDKEGKCKRTDAGYDKNYNDGPSQHWAFQR
jgi:hypothetical protein